MIEHSFFDVVLVDRGPNRLVAMKVLRDCTKHMLSLIGNADGPTALTRDDQRPHLLVYKGILYRCSVPLDDMKSVKAIIDSTPKCIAGHIPDYCTDNYKNQFEQISAHVSIQSPATDYSEIGQTSLLQPQLPVISPYKGIDLSPAHQSEQLTAYVRQIYPELYLLLEKAYKQGRKMTHEKMEAMTQIYPDLSYGFIGRDPGVQFKIINAVCPECNRRAIIECGVTAVAHLEPLIQKHIYFEVRCLNCNESGSVAYRFLNFSSFDDTL